MDSQPVDSPVSKALGEMCSQMHDDDPKLDLQQFDDELERDCLEDPLDDPIEDSQMSPDEPAIPVAMAPTPYTDLVKKSLASSGIFLISHNWENLLDRLCRKTGTFCAKKLLDKAIQDAVQTLGRIDFRSRLCDVSRGADSDHNTFAFLIAIWL